MKEPAEALSSLRGRRETKSRRETAVKLENVRKEFADGTVAVADVCLEVNRGEFFAIVGPSGSGKTTTLRLIAGFEEPTSGAIWIGGKPIAYLSPFERDVNTVFQSYALFPHLDVAGNVAFGLRMKKVPRRQRDERTLEALELVQLKALRHRSVKQLSGGEQQRVALARALVNRPSVLLLDEPLGSLDLKLRREMQLELKAIQEQVGITFIHVTHDQEEAMALADRIAVMHHGELLQTASGEEIYERPATSFVASFFGSINLFDGVVDDVANGTIEISAAGLGGLRVPRKVVSAGAKLSKGQLIAVAVRPERVEVAEIQGASSFTSSENIRFLGSVRRVVYGGSERRYSIQLADGALIDSKQPITGQSIGSGAREGSAVSVTWPVMATKVLPR